MKGTITSLAEDLAAALPAQTTSNLGIEGPSPAFEGKVRYIHTPLKPCDPLFSPPPGHEPERTRLSSHFLVFSVSASHTVGGAVGDLSQYLKHHEEGVLGIAIEVLVYTTKHLTTLFVSKADTTGYIPNHPPSRTKAVCGVFIRWLVKQERQRHPNRKVVVSLFARAQSQYLFPGSAEHANKHILDDRQLIKWWATALDPLLNLYDDLDPVPNIQGYLTIPGYSPQELKTYLPRTPHPPNRSWNPGNPLADLAATRGVPPTAPPRSLLPRFPDDPKARFMQDLDDEVGLAEDAPVTVSPSKRKSGRWDSVRDLARFWEAMDFRQECASGRVVGFLWVVVSPVAKLESGDELHGEAGLSQASSQGVLGGESFLARDATPTPSQPSRSPRKRRRKPLTGPIVSRQPRLKGGSSSLTATSTELNGMLNSAVRSGDLLLTHEGYDKAMHTLLHLDFANLDVAARSTSKWVAEVVGVCGLVEDWGLVVVGVAEAGVGVKGLGGMVGVGNGQGVVNDLGGMVRKKRKAVDEAQVATSTAVNVLGEGVVRKKPKPLVT
ncbi:hypothetical protein LTR91_000081 [Friedmanniomyces endolithicus]|uniref:histone acetyltransferase n=1 Tax=Friedmanniomyces endolithicus TaxID=329885 RepID=A0AAN6J9U3_9PEZI|nr:hypothetical protein LTR35_001516 [Friedmanniomyces endolithicus]KAK0298001.1 hypothetical protein LTS00_003540 [Friedmanniomyces endolithicus]KAK0322634.1 hypothetical protein LTR82_006594 [Friedmanniomyces endolithicus]KAK0999828.1 hypothetical protein LTS01_005236 [Friedmanniomyces endolithicus]KAK1016063.1 hypothetical protein LTR91_000081 [Friedmanniomyces endolithicus]